MISFSRLIVVLMVSFFGLGMSGGVIVHATTVDPSDSPFISQDDDGAAADVNLIGTETQQSDALVNVIKGAINWVLGILALIALIILLYAGFRMVTAAGDEEQYNSGFTILKQAAMGLAMIGVAWFLVSMIFWLVNLFTTTAGPAGTDG